MRHSFGRFFEQLEERTLLSITPLADYDTVSSVWFDSGSDYAPAAAVPLDFVGPLTLAQYQLRSVALSGLGVAEPSQSQWIVRLTPEATALVSQVGDAETLLNTSTADFRVVRGLGLPGQVLATSAVQEAAAIENALRDNPFVASFERNGMLSAQVVPNDPEYSQLWNLENVGQFSGITDADVDAESAWDVTTGSMQVAVAVIDSGMDYTHRDLYRNTWLNQGEIPVEVSNALLDVDGDDLLTFFDLNDSANSAWVSDFSGNAYIDGEDLFQDPRWADGYDTDGNGFVDDFLGWDFCNDDPFPMDDLGHGTHVAGTIGAGGDNAEGVTGLAWKSSLMALKFLDHNNEGSLSDAITAINYVTMMRRNEAANVRVINASWGQSGSDSPALRAAIEAAGAQGILFVAAAGNGNLLGEGLDNDKTPFYPASFPLENIISVAASTAFDDLAQFSNYGAESVDIAAPGVGILSTKPGDVYASHQGTSMAAPHVSGAAALIWSSVPDATLSEVRAAILDGVDPVPALAGRLSSGGRLNAHDALAAEAFGPRAALFNTPDITTAGGSFQEIHVRYSDNVALDVSTLDDADLRVTRLRGSEESFGVALTSITPISPTECMATYRMDAPNGNWEVVDYGEYAVTLQPAQVLDGAGLEAPARALGSFRVQIADPSVIYVNSFEDTPDATIGDGVAADSSGKTTLRAAIQEANTASAQRTVILEAGTYRLTLPGADEDAASTGDLDISGNLVIDGAESSRTTVDANGLDRAFDIQPGATASLFGMAVVNGSVVDDGGAIRNRGELTITRATLSANSASNGGAIASEGVLLVVESTLGDNTATIDGGAIDSSETGVLTIRGATFVGNSAKEGGGVYSSGTMNITNSTVSHNVASYHTGGGIRNAGDATVINCTFFGNQSRNYGGGIHNGYATIYLKNTLSAGNYSTYGHDFYDYSNQFVSQGNNLIGLHGGTPGWKSTDLIGVSPMIGRLQDNGGSTWTHALQRESPAVDAGSDVDVPDADQLGNPRPQDGDGDSAAHVDIGAVELFYGTIEGLRFHDVDADGYRDASEPGLAGLMLYLDLNANQRLDIDEPTTVSRADNLATLFVNEAGTYSFTNIEPGAYHVAQLQEQGWLQTTGIGNQRVSADENGIGGDELSWFAVLNEDGSYIAFESDASNLVPGDTNDVSDVFVFDQNTQTIERVSVAGDGTQAMGHGGSGSRHPSITPDGRFVAFYSYATNLVEGDTNGYCDVFVHDRQNNTTERVSLANDGSEANQQSYGPSISADGRYVAFTSWATNLVPVGSADTQHVFVYDREEHTVELVSKRWDGTPATSICRYPSISADGRFIAYQTMNAILAGDSPYRQKVYVYDRELDTSKCVSLADDGTFANGECERPAISADGHYVVFDSDSTNLVPGDTNTATDVFRYNLQTDTIERVSVASDGSEGNNSSYGAGYNNSYISRDGRYVVFDSAASNLVPGDTNGVVDVFAYDCQLDVIQRISLGQDGQEANGFSRWPSISGDGRYVAYQSAASNLISNDTNGQSDIFVTETLAATQDATLEVSFGAGAVVSGVDLGSFALAGQVHGELFEDTDRDGFMDADEPRLENWTVFADLDENGLLDEGEASVQTDSQGRYSLSGLTPLLTYTIQAIPHDGWVQSFPATSAGGTWTVYVGAGESIANRNFGSYYVGTAGQSMAGILEGRVFADNNGNRLQDSSEPGLAGIEVFLDLNDNGVREWNEPRQVTAVDDLATTGTDESGAYSFPNLGEGIYAVRVVDPGETIHTTPIGNALTPSEYDTGTSSNPQSVTIGDFDGQLGCDIAVANGLNNAISVFLNQGAGSFDAPQTYPVGFSPSAIVVGDFDKQDGIDLAVSNLYRSDVSILLNDGTGHFLPATSFYAGSLPRSLAVGDFNADGNLDLAVANENGPYADTNRVSILLGDGGGAFAAPLGFSAGTRPYSVVAAYLNDDDRLDLAVANSDSDDVSILLNQTPPGGALSFTDTVNYEVVDGPACVSAGDFDGDLTVDLAVTNVLSNLVTILWNDGQGGFGTSSNWAAGTGPMSVTCADLENDGDLDLLVTNGTSDHLAVLRNLGNGSFEPPESYGVGNFPVSLPYSIAAHDLDGNASPDLVIANGAADSVSVMSNSTVAGAHRVELAGTELVANLDFGVRPLSSIPRVVDRHVFYNTSWFDSNDPAANAGDDNAVATDKQALLPGQLATFANYTSYARGINGVMIDVAAPAGTATIDDFSFKVGNTSDLSTWTPLSGTDLPAVTVRAGAGTSGSDRITLVWPDNAVEQQWLQVTVLAGGNLGLIEDDVFYFGNAIGDSGEGNPAGVATAFISDELGARNNPHNFLNRAPVDDAYDYDRNSIVFISDELIARNHQTNFLTGLKLITAPAGAGTASPATAGTLAERILLSETDPYVDAALEEDSPPWLPYAWFEPWEQSTNQRREDAGEGSVAEILWMMLEDDGA